MSKETAPEFIESTAGRWRRNAPRCGAGQAGDDHDRTGRTKRLDCQGTKFARPKVIAEGWSDSDIDRIIDEERKAVQPHLG